MLKLSWKFGESKWYPYGTNNVPNEHEDVDQYGSFSIPSELVLYQSHPESLVNENEIPVSAHEGVDQYGLFSIPFELVLYQSHPESLVNQNEILIELLC